VYAGEDPLTGKRHSPIEIVPPGPKAATLAEAARVRLHGQVDERRNPRTSATVDQLLDRYLETLDVGRTTHRMYAKYPDADVGAYEMDVRDANRTLVCTVVA
jgi:hypothetical protein